MERKREGKEERAARGQSLPKGSEGERQGPNVIAYLKRHLPLASGAGIMSSKRDDDDNNNDRPNRRTRK